MALSLMSMAVETGRGNATALSCGLSLLALTRWTRRWAMATLPVKSEI